MISGGLLLVSAAIYPYLQSYLSSLPKRLTIAEAGDTYLRSVCPINKIGRQQEEIIQKLRVEGSKLYYVGSQEMSNANVRIGALRNNLLSLEKRKSTATQLASKYLSNPKIIWPPEVAKNIEEYADILYEEASISSETADRGFATDKTVDDKNLPSTIRRKLKLPIRGQCPSKYLN